jgi:hypothetical protein
VLIGKKELRGFAVAGVMVVGLCSLLETLIYGVARPMKLKEELKEEDWG